ncbi:MAG: HD domain-containing phosphohydrolase [Mariprofundaceae bacterium]|nr:HD domain-containing phosphohydrolase [Mariprofundaceae bacterium]
MAKYIDLLREHQKRGNKPEDLSAAPATKGKVEQRHEELESMLEEETTAPTDTGPASDKPFANIDLLAGDTIEAHIDSNGHLSTGTFYVDKNGTLSTGTFIPKDGKIPAPGKTDGAETARWLTRCAQLIAKLFISARSNTPASIKPIATHLDFILNEIAKKGNVVTDQLELEISKQIKQIGKIDADLGSLVRKSIMMMLYGIKMGCRLKLDVEQLRLHTLAAMVHHIGMAQVAPEIRKKKELLTEEELNEISLAPEKSHKYLMLCNIADTVILHAASQAQERYDGSGPQALSGSDIAYSARMIGLLSMFEALIHYRPYRHRLLPRDAIRHLVNHHKQAFDPVMLKALIESISLYPVGTYVQLNSGDVALVVRVRPLRPLRPQVLITHDNQGNEMPPREVDLQEQPSLMVERCMYKEQLSELKESSGKESS